MRGVANRELTAELALALGAAAARHLASPGRPGRRVAVVGRDPRASGEMLEAAVIAGLTSQGVDALRVGVLPTPAVAYLTGAYDADFGVMISASHNPMPDNGIKIFGAGGQKLDDDTEDQIENLVASGPGLRPVGAGIGRVVDAEDAAERYLRQVSKASTTPLDGLTVVVDCAHGAASAVAPRAYRAAGPQSSRSTPSPTESTSTTPADRQTWIACGRRSSRIVPTWVWHTTEMPTAAWRSTPTVSSSTATPSWWCWRWPCRKPAN
ncbi:phosphoglucomutase/phosphomannomutase, alpha/beta/alpha domain I family protein [Mycobacterium kansasii]|uniref:Phosphoglucomutase/phosphomannomutase, alpha/beta/alpha domain I family protein n=1 Tax=Mycobacterium kansasii TaxID=1768 RepID=A0A1V3WLC8_MYCKA|nr:phosphoglucomutase/phosphomannomutase, alpha/beta/alpha domain I family protein [Mycobacterium kansasii]